MCFLTHFAYFFTHADVFSLSSYIPMIWLFGSIFFHSHYIIFHKSLQISILIQLMFCCLAATKQGKKEPVKKTTEQKRGKVYLSLHPELRFELDQSYNWEFIGVQQKRPADQQVKQIEEMRKKQKQMNQQIQAKQQQKKRLQKQKQKVQEDLTKLQEQNVKKKAYVAILNYVNLREEQQIQQYRLKL